MKLSSLWIATVFAIVVDDYCAGDAFDEEETTSTISDHDYISYAKSFIPSRLLHLLVDDDIDVDVDDKQQQQPQDTVDFVNGSVTHAVLLEEEEEKVGTVDQYNISNNGCDESKCVSTGLDMLSNYSFTCYADVSGEILDHMMCADGYKPRLVENETDIDSYGYPLQYFSCCPPNLSSDVKVSRHCSNPTSICNVLEEHNNKTIVCDDTNKPHPRPMKTKTKGSSYDEAYLLESYICCDYIVDENNNTSSHTPNFLDEIECVPYNSEDYNKYVIYDNRYGEIKAAYCDEPESGFNFPRFVAYNNTDNYKHYYECCKTEEGSTPFIQDYFFKITVYPQIAISVIAVISSMVLILALLIPLLRNIRTKNTNNAGTSASENRSTNVRTRSQGTATEPTYSSYNLYLVYLAIPDLILNMYLVIMYRSYANQKYNPYYYGAVVFKIDEVNGFHFSAAFIVACSTANLYLNCVVSQEILMLLRKINQVIRCDPPSLLKVTLQATAVYMFSVIVFIIHYLLGRAASKAFEAKEQYRFWRANVILGCLVSYAFPILFFCYVLITIKYRGYMPSVTGRTKQLVWYFFRIVIVFCVIWLPGMCLVVLGATSPNKLYVQIGLIFCGMQPIVSTCMAMTKSDVKKYTMDLLTLSYIRKPTSSQETCASENNNDSS